MTIELSDSLETGRLGVMHLKRLWSRCVSERLGRVESNARTAEWSLDNVIYHGLNLPIEETVRYLFLDAPTFDDFETWVVIQNGGVPPQNDVERINATISGMLSGQPVGSDEPFDKVLRADDLARWESDGYLVVSGLFAEEEVASAERAVWNYLGMSAGDPESWYQRPSDHGIMVQFFHHPALETIRRSEKLRNVFAQLWGTNALWISTDRVSFNPPERPGYEFPGPRLHWDVSLEPPIPFGVQGLVYLTDTTAEQGALTCVPGFHNKIETWLESLPKGTDPRTADLDALGAKPIPGKAGDLVVWHQALPHGASANRASKPRIVEYVTMFPADAGYAENWR